MVLPVARCALPSRALTKIPLSFKAVPFAAERLFRLHVFYTVGQIFDRAFIWIGITFGIHSY
jgi:hypothetical protein